MTRPEKGILWTTNISGLCVRFRCWNRKVPLLLCAFTSWFRREKFAFLKPFCVQRLEEGLAFGSLFFPDHDFFYWVDFWAYRNSIKWKVSVLTEKSLKFVLLCFHEWWNSPIHNLSSIAIEAATDSYICFMIFWFLWLLHLSFFSEQPLIESWLLCDKKWNVISNHW